MPLHILQLGPVPPPEGGISRNIFAIRNELLSAGHRCSIVATSKSDLELPDEDVHYPRSKRELISLLRTLDFDVLHLHVGGDITARVLSLAFACTVLARGKCVLTMHSGGYASSDGGRKAGPSTFAGIVFRRFSKVIAVNDDLAAVFSRFGVDERDIHVILPFTLQPPGPVDMPDGLDGFCDSASPLFVSVGGLEKDYEPLLQIAAFTNVKKELPNSRLVIIGGGSMKAEAEAAISSGSVADSIYLAGNVQHDVALTLMALADAVLRVTLFDGDAISVREALYLGTPVIATDNGMRTAGVQLVPVGDQAALTSAMSKVTSTPKPAVSASPAPDNRNASKVVDLYEEIASK